MKKNKTKIYITGSRGFIGSNLQLDLAKDSKFELIKESKGYLQYNSLPDEKADIIFHLASNTNTLFKDDTEMFDNNISAFLRVVDYCKYSNAKLIWASSSAIYGNGNGPLNAYAHSKLVIEEIAKYFSKQIPIVGLRFFNVFGPGEIKKGKMASMITQWAEQIKQGNQPKVFQELQSPVLRDHIYVKDIVKAMKLAIDKENGTYDVGSGQAYTWVRVLKDVQKALKTNQKIKWIKNNNLNTYQTFTKAKLDWGFTPSYSLEEGIEDYLTNHF